MKHSIEHNKIGEDGFTLVELMIVIAIIGILATVSIVSLSSTRSKARDAKRISDIRNLVAALELYNIDNTLYPYCQGYGGCDITLEEGFYPADSSKDGAFMSFLNPYFGGATPVDPINNDQYFYAYGVGEFPHDSGILYYYGLSACLENPGNLPSSLPNNLTCPVGSPLCEYFKNNCFIIAKRYP